MVNLIFRPAFIQYIQPCFEAIYKQLEHPQLTIRKRAIESLAQFAISMFKLNDVAGAQKAVGILLPKYAELLKNDEEIHIAMSVFEAYMEILENLKHQALFNEELKALVFSCIHDVFSTKIACQFNDNSGDDEFQEDSEYSVALYELAGEVLPKFGSALQPQEFALYFGRALPLLLEKLHKALDNEDLQSDRSLVYGTLSESFSVLQGCTATWFDNLLPLYLKGLQDEYEQARQNAVFGIGEMVLYGEDKAYSHYAEILQALSQVVAVEEHPSVLDNVCGALARLIIANSSLIPLEHVLPVFIQKLPLREDFHENKSVFRAFNVLLAQSNEAFLAHLPLVLMNAIRVLGKKEYKDDGKSSVCGIAFSLHIFEYGEGNDDKFLVFFTETKEIVFNFLQEGRQRYPEYYQQAISTDPEIAQFAQLL